jgi:hypothetical protein
MTIDEARTWLILTALIATGATFVFFLVGPALGYPLTWAQATRCVEVLLPVFVGYLGSATHFLFSKGTGHSEIILQDRSNLLRIMVKGPVVVFSVAAIAVLFAFSFSNRVSAPPGVGMSIDTLSWSITAALGLLTATTSVEVAYLFSVGGKK